MARMRPPLKTLHSRLTSCNALQIQIDSRNPIIKKLDFLQSAGDKGVPSNQNKLAAQQSDTPVSTYNVQPACKMVFTSVICALLWSCVPVPGVGGRLHAHLPPTCPGMRSFQTSASPATESHLAPTPAMPMRSLFSPALSATAGTGCTP